MSTSKAPRILVLGTGGTIAGAGSGGTGAGYRPGGLPLDVLVGHLAALGLAAELVPQEIARIGSQDIGFAEWQALHAACIGAMDDPAIDAVIITHGTDTAEETGFLLDLTLPTTKPVILVGAMRPADAVGADGMRNFANAVKVASDVQAAGRGVMLVMGDAVLAVRDARKAATSAIDAFRTFPRGPLARVTPASLDWFGPAHRVGERARYPFPTELPRVAILTAGAGMDAKPVEALLGIGARGIVLAGMGQGNAPAQVLEALARAAASGVPVVRASRVDEGLVDRNVEVDDDALGLVAARALGPARARMLLMVLIATGITEAAAVQAAFDG
ncbi:asparaginase [Erythrobacter sp. BLCC-B19]|uniref:asparaginase n=1 Tax=Erythrobacter sp. BLCC-B19 TaxID=3025315 RepID=UPI00235DEA99|nr:asparaginase [Erythrobacter sp. BLCC-B19]WDA40013.1 asparaginase [Erythrobacter sp. BLCC-B19]